MATKPPSKKNNGESIREPRPPIPGERELIVIAAPEAGLRARADGPTSLAGADVGPLAAALEAAGATLKPLFGPSEDHLNLKAEAPGATTVRMPDNLGRYYRVECPEEKMEEMAAQLRSLPTTIEAAYVKPAPSPAVEVLNTMLPRTEDVPATTPDLTGRQGYLDAAPGGVDALFSWTVPGGRGAGVKVIDIEGAWRFTHEDLTQNQGGVVGGTESTDVGWRNHGTAVIGVIGGDANAFGVSGVAPDANVRAISIFGIGTAPAIRRAADLLGYGDLILIELHRPGPLATNIGQQGFIAIEWWPDDYDAIRYAVSRGVIVIEAAGNGAQDLDNPAYDNPAPGFPASWSNPFRRGGRDSGAILVGAGAPPSGTHGSNHGPDRSRLDFSNYGAAVDGQGWGREVTTCAYGDLQGGPNEDVWYTDRFSGTSSASPILVGSLACIQGVRKARGLSALDPLAARALLRSTGSPQQDAPQRPASQRIGNRPNIRQMITQLQPSGVRTTPLHRYWNPSIGDHFYTTSWAELGYGRHGWSYEGVQCHVYPTPTPGTSPLYRYWNPSIGDHFYTTNWAELGYGRYGWNYEGIQCFVNAASSAGTGALYRYWNPSIGDHFYTTNWHELGSGRYGYQFEGIQCYVELRERAAAVLGPPPSELGRVTFEQRLVTVPSEGPLMPAFGEPTAETAYLGGFDLTGAWQPPPVDPSGFAQPPTGMGVTEPGYAPPSSIAPESFRIGASPDVTRVPAPMTGPSGPFDRPPSDAGSRSFSTAETGTPRSFASQGNGDRDRTLHRNSRGDVTVDVHVGQVSPP